MDVDKDGHLDLVMGTPHYSQGNLTQNGMVAIFPSSKAIGCLNICIVFLRVYVPYTERNPSLLYRYAILIFDIEKKSHLFYINAYIFKSRFRKQEDVIVYCKWTKLDIIHKICSLKI